MEIEIFKEYEVISHLDGSYLNVEGEIVPISNYEKFKVDGGELMVIIGRHLTDEHCFSIRIGERNIKIECFDPTTGVSDDYIYTIKEVEDNGR